MIKYILNVLLGSKVNSKEPVMGNLPRFTTITISEEYMLEIDSSKKILDIILKDLERFPPHEWISDYLINDNIYFKHKCLNYELCFYYSSYIPYVKVLGLFLTLEHQSVLYHNFYLEFHRYKMDCISKEYNVKLNNFSDDDKRILCKETDDNE